MDNTLTLKNSSFHRLRRRRRTLILFVVLIPSNDGGSSSSVSSSTTGSIHRHHEQQQCCQRRRTPSSSSRRRPPPQTVLPSLLDNPAAHQADLVRPGHHLAPPRGAEGAHDDDHGGLQVSAGGEQCSRGGRSRGTGGGFFVGECIVKEAGSSFCSRFQQLFRPYRLYLQPTAVIPAKAGIQSMVCSKHLSSVGSFLIGA